MKKFLALLFVSVLFVSCDITGEEIGRLPINKLSIGYQHVFAKELTLDLKKGEEISIWSDMDVEFQGEIQTRFRVKVYKDKLPYDELDIDPFKSNFMMNEFSRTINGYTQTSFNAKNHVFTVKENGKYTFEGIYTPLDYSELRVHKAELVFKK
ncbi:hypothetical protein ACLI1A_02255 [Flavobacterium sp. RHBU_3]|uniref:hypothetical protein n=1 Tax=Flavobacterium sp. RHBU_3 TaxID=3391184 RepID=UPI00398545A1